MRTRSGGRFVGKTALVTGAAQGIGEAVSQRLIEEGAFVFGVDLREASSRPTHEQMQLRRCDITDYAAVKELVRDLEGTRPIDLLVNAAGILSSCAFDQLTPEIWQRTLAVNASGAFNVSTCVSQGMRARRSGGIVTVASNAATTPRVGMAAYCASKAAVAMLTRCMGLELSAYNIRCNIVSPGSTDTPMLQMMIEGAQGARAKLVGGDPATFRNGIPLRKIATPEEIASGVAFLLSDDASHITLHDLVIDGGATF